MVWYPEFGIMGCLMSKKSIMDQSNRNEEEQRQRQQQENFKSYSWLSRDRSQRHRYVMADETDTFQIRLPGEIDGEQFIIQNCIRCTIALMDHSNTVTIDDCRDCIIFIGPTAGSIVMRNCQECRIMSASQQFRCRDCRCLKMYLFCSSQPAIESCYDLSFGCFAANYQGLQEQFERANLKIYNNKWFNVYDFSVDEHERHWSVLPLTSQDAEHFQSSISADANLRLSFDPASSLVPRTEGIVSFNEIKCDLNNVSVLLFYCHTTSIERLENRVRRFIQELELTLKGLQLFLTKQLDTIDTVTKLLNRAKIIENKEIITTTGKQSEQLPPDRLIMLLYRGNFVLRDIYENFQRTATTNQHHYHSNIMDQPQGTEIKFQIIDGQQNQRFLDDCLSLVFDNSF